MAKLRNEKSRTSTDCVHWPGSCKATHISAVESWCRCSRYGLLSTLYRHDAITSVEKIARLESQLMTRFRQPSIPLHSRSLADDWDALFFMQHYGVLTRPLDWTENSFVGLYFATTSAPFERAANGKPQFLEDVAVWILDPVAWNRHSLSHTSYDGEVLAPGDDSLKGLKPAPTFAGMNKHPVALHGAHNSPRIVAQRGVFTIFGQNTKAMEKVFDHEGFPGDCLIKVILKRSRIFGFRKSVLTYGVCESVVFPDLKGLAKEIRRNFGFEV
jgi:hypothetical protein